MPLMLLAILMSTQITKVINKIMADNNDISDRIRERQVRLGRIMLKNGVTFTAVSIDSGIPYNSIRSYFSQEKDAVISVMSLSSLVRLFGVIPDEWLNILTEPEGRCFHGLTKNERAAEERIQAIRDACDEVLAEMRAV